MPQDPAHDDTISSSQHLKEIAECARTAVPPEPYLNHKLLGGHFPRQQPTLPLGAKGNDIRHTSELR
jgi:hypothetical protein